MTEDEVIGKQVGPYVLMEKLGSGGFGHVYKAHHVHLPNRIVALKIFKEAGDSKTFLREARMLDQLRHPTILSVSDVDIHLEPLGRDLPYMVTEYAPGGSLRDRLKAIDRLMDDDEAVNIIAHIGEGLSYAHQKGIVHRDLKPENILFGASGEVLLADFGISIVLSSGSRSSDFLGTAAYMAPEQFDGIISRKSDQYALACILYELVTGQQPFAGYKGAALAYQQVHAPPLPPRQLNRSLPAYRERVILKAMAKDREERYSDVLAFVTALTTPLQERPRRPFEELNLRRRARVRDEEESEEEVGRELESVDSAKIRLVDPVFEIPDPPRMPVAQRAHRQLPLLPGVGRRRLRKQPRQAWERRNEEEEEEPRRSSFPSRKSAIDRVHRQPPLLSGPRQPSWPDVSRVRQTSRQTVRGTQDDEEEGPRRRYSSPRQRSRVRYLEEDGLGRENLFQAGRKRPRHAQKNWLRILCEPCCALVVLLVAWKMTPDPGSQASSPLSTLLLFSLLILLIVFHAFFVGSSSERGHRRWSFVAWLTEVCFCFWCLFLLVAHFLGGVVVLFEWTIFASSLAASLYWWCYP